MTVLKARYLCKDDQGNIIESPRELFLRVAKVVAQAEVAYGGKKDLPQWEERFYDLMRSRDFFPNSPTLMNAGKGEGQLSACFVLPVGDSMPEIFESVKYAAMIQKSGGGVGYSFSRLRPQGDRVRSTDGVSSGPLSFMRVFNEATETVKQGGKRRGANMGVLRVDHPDIMEFVNSKTEEGIFSNFNISVGITDIFMQAVKNNGEYELINPRSKKKSKKVPARPVWENIVRNAWYKGEPGILFLDTINRHNPTPKLGDIESTNPCGEACLLPFEACNLGSVNLSNFVQNRSVDYKRLKEVVHLAVRFLDDVIDVNEYVPSIPQIARTTRHNRKIGLGVMGFADMLIKLGISYQDEMALKIADYVMEFIQKEAREASSNLARQRGCFPNWQKSVFFPDTPLRNASITSIAPTGTLSIIAGCSPGIEPLFGVCFERNILDGKKLLEIHPLFEKIARERGFYSEQLMKKLAGAGTLRNIPQVPDDVKKLFVTTYDLSPKRHIEIQAVFQRHVDMSVSKTINLPHNATPEDVDFIYNTAWQMGCKGLTVYRYGSRDSQVMVLGDSRREENEKDREKSEEITVREVRETTDKDTIIAEAEVKERADKDTIIAEAEVKDRADKDTIIAEAEVKDRADKDTIIAEAEVKDRADKDTIIAEAEVKDRADKDTIITEVELKDRADKDTIITEPEVRETTDNNTIITEPEVRETTDNNTIIAEMEVEPPRFFNEDVGDPFFDDMDYTNREISCPECGMGTLIIGACSTCPHCGYSKCG